MKTRKIATFAFACLSLLASNGYSVPGYFPQTRPANAPHPAAPLEQRPAAKNENPAEERLYLDQKKNEPEFERVITPGNQRAVSDP